MQDEINNNNENILLDGNISQDFEPSKKTPAKGLRRNDSIRNAVTTTMSTKFEQILGFFSPTPENSRFRDNKDKTFSQSNYIGSVVKGTPRIEESYKEEKSMNEIVGNKPIKFNDQNTFISPEQFSETSESLNDNYKSRAGRTPFEKNASINSDKNSFINNVGNYNYNISSLSLDKSTKSIVSEDSSLRKTLNISNDEMENFKLESIISNSPDSNYSSNALELIISEANSLTSPFSSEVKSTDDLASSTGKEKIEKKLKFHNHHDFISPTSSISSLNNSQLKIQTDAGRTPYLNKHESKENISLDSESSKMNEINHCNNLSQIKQSSLNVGNLGTNTQHNEIKSNVKARFYEETDLNYKKSNVDVSEYHSDIPQPTSKGDHDLSNNEKEIIQTDINHVLLNRLNNTQNIDVNTSLDYSIMSYHHLSSEEYKYLLKKRKDSIEGKIKRSKYIEAIDLLLQMTTPEDYSSSATKEKLKNNSINFNNKSCNTKNSITSKTYLVSKLNEKNNIKMSKTNSMSKSNENFSLYNEDVQAIRDLPDNISESSPSEMRSVNSNDESDSDYYSSGYNAENDSTIIFDQTVNNTVMESSNAKISTEIESVNKSFKGNFNQSNREVKITGTPQAKYKTMLMQESTLASGVSFAKPAIFNNFSSEIDSKLESKIDSTISKPNIEKNDKSFDDSMNISVLDGCQEPLISKKSNIDCAKSSNEHIQHNLNLFNNNADIVQLSKQDFSMQYPSANNSDVLDNLANQLRDSLSYSIDSNITIDKKINSYINSYTSTNNNTNTQSMLNSNTLDSDSLSHIPLGRYSELDSINSSIDTTEDNYKKFDINIIDISKYNNTYKKPMNLLLSNRLPSRVLTTYSEIENDQDHDDEEINEIDTSSIHKNDVSTLDNETLATTSVFSEATTITFDSMIDNSNISPNLVIKSKSRNKNELSQSMKEINCITSPGTYTTIQLKLTNRKSYLLSMHAAIIQTRFDSTSAFTSFITDSNTIESDLAFQISPKKLRLHPNEDGIFFITFSPSKGHEGIYSGAVKIRSKKKSFDMLLRGEAYYSTEERELQKSKLVDSNLELSNHSMKETKNNISNSPSADLKNTNSSLINLTPSSIATDDMVNAVIDLNQMSEDHINNMIGLENKVFIEEKKHVLKNWISKAKVLSKGLSKYPELLMSNKIDTSIKQNKDNTKISNLFIQNHNKSISNQSISQFHEDLRSNKSTRNSIDTYTTSNSKSQQNYNITNNKSINQNLLDSSSISSLDNSHQSEDRIMNQSQVINTSLTKIQQNPTFFRVNNYSFGSLAIGRILHNTIELCNNSDDEIKFYLSIEKPFYGPDYEMKIKARSYGRIPIRFVPTTSGDFEQILRAKTLLGEYLAGTVIRGTAYMEST